ncbi:acyl-ACP--UDP-N-acetylglucosamine O-acyltransferase [Megasphaera paucivorans]|uniref:Acyl-[acyl-carrier-protein]--UDP-N-acetylglucosamine O-acyltransferase n=1 Tax=Megasphaera paucivorans TaxID=349095 RepID=A0A1G9TKV7_9FIRM|nr:acyl-ACP--UDP-N-acetylglucosamine O-acyltransferase [Megasphaera paucivorans]SDM48074.1 acyl-[acyl-carrier-protein]--UDP-N-acetylglucosamine O-acyltransferase [Megasphaera paucivorans]
MTEEKGDMQKSMIHPTAIIDPHAKIGPGVKIGPYAVIGPNVEIGEGTEVMAHVVIDGWTTIGKYCRFFPSASIGSEPQDLKFNGEKSYVTIGDYSVFREFVTVSRATGEEDVTSIGSHCLFQACTHIAHNCDVGNYVIMSNCAGLAGHVTIEDRVVIGGIAGVHQFVKVGRNSMIGGLAKVVQDIPPFVIADGQPARCVGLNSVGLSRAGIPENIRSELKKAFRILYRSGLNLGQAIAEMEQELDSSEEVEHFLRFLRNAERGICRGTKA